MLTPHLQTIFEALDQKKANDPFIGLEFVTNFELLHKQMSSIVPAVKQARQNAEDEQSVAKYISSIFVNVATMGLKITFNTKGAN